MGGMDDPERRQQHQRIPGPGDQPDNRVEPEADTRAGNAPAGVEETGQFLDPGEVGGTVGERGTCGEGGHGEFSFGGERGERGGGSHAKNYVSSTNFPSSAGERTARRIDL